MSALIEARGLTKHYDGFSLEGVDLTVGVPDTVQYSAAITATRHMA